MARHLLCLSNGTALACHASFGLYAPGKNSIHSSVDCLAACIQEAGIPAKFAKTIGIAVDHRRRNRSLESLQVCSLRLILFQTYAPSMLAVVVISKSVYG